MVVKGTKKKESDKGSAAGTSPSGGIGMGRGESGSGAKRLKGKTSSVGSSRRVTRSSSRSEVDKNLHRDKSRIEALSKPAKEIRSGKVKGKDSKPSSSRHDSDAQKSDVTSGDHKSEPDPIPSEIKPLMDMKTNIPESQEDLELSRFVSCSTGLTVLLASHNVPGHAISIEDRSLLMKSLPNVVLMNTSGKNDSLVIGLDARPVLVQELSSKLEEKMKNWSFSLEDVSSQDPFSYFSTWNIIPKVDKQGVYSLIVNLRLKGGIVGGKSKQHEAEERRNLLDVTENFSLLKVIHGEGETMIQVGHVLEFIAYSDCIRKLFAIERKHTWQIKPTGRQVEAKEGMGSDHKYVWVKVNSDDINGLSPAHKQYTVNLHLKSVGKVIQLEHQLFGVSDNYLAVFDGTEKFDLSKIGPNFNVLVIPPCSLPDGMIPTYGVDDFGFYTVSGTFPSDVCFDSREGFSADMKTAGAVGFRTGVSEHEFSLHFVNSSSLEKVNKLTQYSNFNLKIHSSLIKKASLEKKIKKLVPAILKIKESHGKVVDDSKPVKRVTIVEDLEKGKLSHPKTKKASASVLKTDSVFESDEDSKGGHQPCKEEICSVTKDENKNTVPSSKKTENSDDSTHSSVQVKLSDLLKANWLQGKGPAGFSKSFGKFLTAFDKIEVKAVGANDLEFLFKDKRLFNKHLKFYSKNDTNSKEKLRAANPKVVFIGNKFKTYKGCYGLAVSKKKMKDKEMLTKHLSDFSSFKIEDRAGVFIAWFESKLDYFKVLANRKLNAGFSMCLVNFEEAGNEESTAEDVKADDDTEEDHDNKVYKLTEKQVFDFIWRIPFEDTYSRADHHIARKLTDFIQMNSFSSIDYDNDEGLVFHVKSKKAYEEILAKYCEDALGDEKVLPGLTRKFALIPNRGNFGIFSTNRLRYEDLKKVGRCKIYNSSMWFSNKMDMIRVLRDPMLQKKYQLFIDCRNVLILRSLGRPAKPRFATSFSPFFSQPGFQKEPSYPQMLSNVHLPRAFYRPKGSFTGSVFKKLFPSPFLRGHASNPRLNENYFNYNFTHGKFGVLPSPRMVRDGFKLFKVPHRPPREFSQSDLFLEDKEVFRNKDFKDAATEVKKLMAGGGDTHRSLKDLKMKRVEMFLREKLGVDNVQVGCGQGANFFVNLIEGNKRFEEVSENENKDSLTPDLLGYYTLTVPYPEGSMKDFIAKLEDEVSWFEAPVSVLPVVDSSGNSILEIKMKSEEVTLAAYRGLKPSYPEMEVDKTGAHVDIIPDKETGLFTLMFLDKHQKKYAGTMATFRQYCTNSTNGPFVSKGPSPGEVVVAFKVKTDAINALKENLDNDGFPELHVAPSSRS